MANEILAVRWAMADAALIPGVRRARLVANADVKRSAARAGGMSAGSWKTGAAPQLVLECEGIAAALDAIHGSMAGKTIVLHIQGADANFKRTCKFCTATAVGDSRFPPAEGSGSTPLVQITFDLHAGTAVDELDEALVDAADTDSVPAETALPLVQLVSAARGAAGATAIDTAVEATLRCQMAAKRGRRTAGGLPAFCAVTSVGTPQVSVVLESATEWLTAVTGAVIDEILVLVFAAGSTTKTLTCQVARLVAPGDEQIEAAEQSGTAARHTLVFDIVGSASIGTPAQALVLT